MTSDHRSSPRLIRTVAEMQAYATGEARSGRRIALVPTMGALHEGHLALVEEAGRRADTVVVSIFVNPTQFGPTEDFDAYPRELDDDIRRLDEQAITDIVFSPPVDQMYPLGEPLTWVSVERLGKHLCGSSRPGHFRGVTTVVSKLFTICRPHTAVFGLKDAQQFFIIQRMARELHFPVDIAGVPTVRERDGLARSSRNKYLDPEERAQAVVLSKAVTRATRLIENGERDAERVVDAMSGELERADRGRPDYARVVETETLQPVQTLEPGSKVLAAVAVYFGQARLIDNAIVDVP